MKKIQVLGIIMMAAIMLSSCQKEESNTPDFDVITSEITVKAGAAAEFNFVGDANSITFYSGQPGEMYENRERTEFPGGKVQLSFATTVQFGTQPRNINVLVSKNFSGTYTPAAIAAATWVDISDNFSYAINSSSTNYIPSGKFDISPYVEKGKPLYVAFKYVGDAAPTATKRTWTIRDITLSNLFPNNQESIIANTIPGFGFLTVDVADPANFWAINSTTISFAPRSSLLYTEDWAISSAFNNLDKVNPDNGIAIKSFAENKIAKYTYTGYLTPGVYKASFVASNSTAYGEKTVVKEVTVTVQP